MTNSQTKQISDAREAYVTLLEISRLMNTGLDPESLILCVRLCEAGINPEALSGIIREIRSEMEKIHQSNVNSATHLN